MYIPILTTVAGSCLTLANWQEAMVTTVCYELKSLLIKPGLALLKSYPNLKFYIGAPAKLNVILDARLELSNRVNDEHYVIRSPMDGQLVKISKSDFIDLIIHLEPNLVILSEDFAQEAQHISSCTKNIKIYILEERASNRPNYFLPGVSLGQFAIDKSAQIISDVPAQDGFCAKVYTNNGIINLLDDSLVLNDIYNVIEPLCTCPVCRQKFSKRYLKHLMQQVPLLGQRFLIQHNMYFLSLLHLPEMEF